MPDPIRIWTAASHHAAFRCGGWAFVRQADGALSGAAGGERQTTAARMELAGLAAALEGLAAGGSAVVHTPSAALAGKARWVAGEAVGEDAPAEDLDLWARIAAAAKGRTVRLARTEAAPKTPGAFCAAWAELARDKSKATGAFASPIPRPNLAKVQGV